MGKFLDEEYQAEVFRVRYLSKHALYLKSISDMIDELYGDPSPKTKCQRMLLRLRQARELEKGKDLSGEEPQFRGLRNCWYHECSLNYTPILGVESDRGWDVLTKELDERMRFAAWKIIQAYYSVFSSIAAIVTCLHQPTRSHNKVLNIFVNSFVCSHELGAYCPAPLNLHLNEQGCLPAELQEQVKWGHDKKHRIPAVLQALREVRENRQNGQRNRKVGIPHYLRDFRDWATYEDSYLFIRLFGIGPKLDLDYSLRSIAFAFNVQAEFFLLRKYGWIPVQRQFKYFREQMEKNLKTSPSLLIERFQAYSENRDSF